MAYETKFGWISGFELGYTVFQPDGTGRGITNQHLLEVRTSGYYRDTPATALIVGDVIIVYRRWNVEHESVGVHYLEYEDVYYENVQVQYEGEYIKDFDTASNQPVISLVPVGSGEFEDVAGTTDDIDTLKALNGRVNMVIDETTNGDGRGQVLTSTGTLITEGGDC